MGPKDKKIITWIVITVLAVAGVMAIYNGLNKANSETTDSGMGYVVEDYDYPSEDSYLGEEPAVISKDESGDGSVTNSEDEKIQKYGYLDLIVTDLDQARLDVERYAQRYGGSVATLNESGTGNYRLISMTIKVPVEKFDTVVEDLRALAEDVDSVEISSNDVTEQYYDIQARLENQQSLEAQLVELLDMAKDVEDVLMVQTELSDVRETIERYQAQLDYYDQSTDYSTVTVLLSLSADEVTIVDDTWSATAIFKEAAAALVDFAQQIAGGLIWFAVFIPVIALILLIVWIVKVVSKRSKVKKGKK